MSTVGLRMPPQIASTATLATQVVDAGVPQWAASRAVVTLAAETEPERVTGRRSERDVFRLPNSSQALRDWLYTRSDVEAVDEEALANCVIESSTIFRIEDFHVREASVEISPTVSNHWLLVPVQSINGVTVGLAYLDVLYQRKKGAEHCVPAMRVGKFALENSTGEIFMTGWMGPIMVVCWVQSIIKCERVREMLMYQAPPYNGLRPRNLLLRNSFYERRDCRLCGLGHSLTNLQPPCSGVSNNLAHDPSKPAPLANVATLYRRFRGAYFGVCAKTAFLNGKVQQRTLVPVFIHLKYGLNTVKQRFRVNLRRNCDFALNDLFGLGPTTGSRLMFLRTSEPVSSLLELTDGTSSTGKRKAPCDEWDGANSGVKPMLTSPTTSVSSERSASPPSRRRRRVGVDEVDRESIEFERKRRNRIAAERSNRLRKEKLEREREELRCLKERREKLLARHSELSAENFALRSQVEAARNEFELLPL